MNKERRRDIKKEEKGTKERKKNEWDIETAEIEEDMGEK
jgi:hypothetical protein